MIGIIAFIVIYLTKPFEKKSEPAEPEVVEEVVTLANNCSLWMKYVFNQSINSITVTTVDENDYSQEAILTKKELADIFEGFMSYKLTKSYSVGDSNTETEETTSEPVLIVTYTKAGDTNEYALKVDGNVVTTLADKTDEGLVSAIEDSDHEVENDEDNGEEMVPYKFILKDFDETIYDKYVNK